MSDEPIRDERVEALEGDPKPKGCRAPDGTCVNLVRCRDYEGCTWETDVALQRP